MPRKGVLVKFRQHPLELPQGYALRSLQRVLFLFKATGKNKHHQQSTKPHLFPYL